MTTAEQTEQQLIESDIEAYLAQHHDKELLRFVAVGSVDDGKSTLIGRLLHDTKGVYEDQLSAVKRASRQTDVEIDFSLFTDGLKAEREQGITIDVAYRYFSTAARKFIIADTPGHVQYTRNMATGASTANVALILIDARLGVLEQSRRHAYIASLLGIPHLFVCVNKMDLKQFSQEVYEAIRADFSQVAATLGFKDVTFIPISALRGDNLVHRSSHMPWYQGKTLLEHLETVPISSDRNLDSLRFPVQYVLRPNLDYRGFAGQVASGVVAPGDEILVLPSRRRTRVKAVDQFQGPVARAFAPMSVTLRLEHEVDVSRGDMLVHPEDVPHVGQHFEAMLVWMNDRALDTAKSYLLKHTTQYVRADFERVEWAVDLETLKQVPAATLDLNDIGRVRVRTHRPIFFDAYAQNRATGSFIVIDSITNNTVAAGMIVARDYQDEAPETRQGSQVSRREREERLGQSGRVVWLGPGSTVEQTTLLAYSLERLLVDAGRVALVVSPVDGLSAAAAPGQAPDASVELALRLAHAGLIAIFAHGAPLPAELADRLGERLVLADAAGLGEADPEQAARELLQRLV